MLGPVQGVALGFSGSALGIGGFGGDPDNLP